MNQDNKGFWIHIKVKYCKTKGKCWTFAITASLAILYLLRFVLLTVTGI